MRSAQTQQIIRPTVAENRRPPEGFQMSVLHAVTQPGAAPPFHGTLKDSIDHPGGILSPSSSEEKQKSLNRPLWVRLIPDLLFVLGKFCLTNPHLKLIIKDAVVGYSLHFPLCPVHINSSASRERRERRLRRRRRTEHAFGRNSADASVVHSALQSYGPCQTGWMHLPHVDLLLHTEY